MGGSMERIRTGGAGMKIEGCNRGMGAQTGMRPGDDEVSRSLQAQIQNKQQEMQKLSENKNMPPEEKLKKRQEIQQEISNLQMQLRQHQLEQRRKQQEGREDSLQKSRGGKELGPAAEYCKSQGTGLSQGGMQSMLSADAALKQSKVHDSVASRLEGRAGVLEAEIHQGSLLGRNTSAKEKELAQVEKRAEDASRSRADMLGEANQAVRKARESEEEKAEKEGSEKEEERKNHETDLDTPRGSGL